MGARSTAGSRRRNLALVVVGASILSAGAGVLVGRRLQSPADAAAGAAAPDPSRITVPVERRSLESRLVANGDLEYQEPAPIRLAGPVGASAGATQIVTRAPALEAALAEGDVFMEVSGRPVFVFQGALPTYRSFEPGVTGPDVQQLEEALVRLGLDPGPVDTVYDDATEAALDQLYALRGYQSEGPTAEQRTQLRAAEKAVADAEAALTRAKADLATAGKPIAGSELLRQQQALQSAKDAVPAAEAAATRRNADAVAAVTAATTARDAAKAARDTAKSTLDAAKAPTAVSPATGLPYTTDELKPFEDDLAAKETALAQAETELRTAISDRDTTATEVAAAIEAARDALLLAQLTYDEAVAPKDTGAAGEAVFAAQQAVDQARADLLVQQSQVGTKMPAGEMVFLPTLPTTITEVTATLGKAPADPVATASSTQSQIRGRIGADDADLVRVGTRVAIELRDADLATTGVVADIEEPQGDGNGDGSGDGGGSDERLTILVQPDDPSVLADFIGFSVRLTITASSTDGEVLAVPVAALSVGADGESRVEVERSAGDEPGAVETVTVTVGLSADGYAEVTPVGASLVAGDRVVVGTDSGRRGSDDPSDSGDGEGSGG